MISPPDNAFEQLSAFLLRLAAARIAYQLTSVREGAVMVQVAVPGERWEFEFFSDRPVEAEVFRSNGEIFGPDLLESLFAAHGS